MNNAEGDGKTRKRIDPNASWGPRTIIIIGAGILAAAALIALLWYISRPRYNLEAAYSASAPKIDGSLDDAAWDKAETLTIPTENGPDIELKALYSSKEVFFAAKYEDKTKDAVGWPWTYDGKDWTRGLAADSCGFFFVIGDSIKPFKSKGFKIMTYGLGEDVQQISELAMVRNKDNAEDWPGVKGAADVWQIYTNTVLPTEDMYFGTEAHNRVAPTGNTNALITIWDGSERIGLTKLNTNVWEQAMIVSEGGTAEKIDRDRPYLMYKNPKDTIENSPYPFADQLIPITDDKTFSKGDTTPFVYFTEESKEGWGGSRSDVTGKMTWKDGFWTAEVSRELNTKHNDDIVFKPGAETEIDFGFIVRWNSKQTTSFSPPAILTFKPRGTSNE